MSLIRFYVLQAPSRLSSKHSFSQKVVAACLAWRSGHSTRIRENLGSLVTHQLMTVIQDYQAAQQSYKVSIHKKVSRQLHIMQPNITKEEVEDILSSNEKSSGGSGSGDVREGWYKQQILSYGVVGDVNDQVK